MSDILSSRSSALIWVISSQQTRHIKSILNQCWNSVGWLFKHCCYVDSMLNAFWDHTTVTALYLFVWKYVSYTWIEVLMIVLTHEQMWLNFALLSWILCLGGIGQSGNFTIYCVCNQLSVQPDLTINQKYFLKLIKLNGYYILGLSGINLSYIMLPTWSF